MPKIIATSTVTSEPIRLSTPAHRTFYDIARIGRFQKPTVRARQSLAGERARPS